MADTSHSLRTSTDLLHAFGKAAARFPFCPRMLAFLNAATADGLVTVPSSLVPRRVSGEPVIGTLNIGGDGKLSFLDATFYGIGGAQLETETGLVNVGFVLYGRANDEAVKTFRELGGEAGVLVHIQDSFGGVRNYDNPLVLWALKVYSTLRGSSWLSQIDEITENTTFHFNPFTASVETLKRFNAPAQSDQFIDRLLTGPDDAELSARDLALLEAHLQQPVSFATIQQEKQATGHSATEAAQNKLKLIRDFNRRLTAKPVEAPVIGTERPSPFTIPQPAFQFESAATEERPARSMTVGGMIHNLNVFADYYERATEDLDTKTNPFDKRYFAAGRDANADTMQRDFRSAIAIDRVRAYVLGKFGAELTIGTARRFLGDLIRNFGLTTEAAEALALEEAMEKLDAASTSTEPAPAMVVEPIAPAGPSGFLGGTALADALGVHPSRRDAFFKQLERDRTSFGDENWQEVSNRRANTPRFQYRADTPKLRELANTYKEPKPT